MGRKLECITELPKFISIDEETQLGAIPIPRTHNLREAKERLTSCRIPLKIPPGKYLRAAHDREVAILELIRFGERWMPQVSWVTRTRNLLPRRTLYSRDLPLTVPPQDLTRPCVHPNAPPFPSKLWRYMDFWKFEHLLQERAIFLTRSDLVNDKREASLSLANLRYRNQVYKKRPKMARRHNRFVQELPNMKRWTYISCWRVDEFENERSWATYAKSNDAIAVRTTYRKLLVRTATIYSAGVEYIDYFNTWVIETDTLHPFMYKGKEYGWEREFRIILQRFPTAKVSFEDALFFDCAAENPNCGLILRVDLLRLIDEIVVAPNSSYGFCAAVQQLAANCGLGERVRRSALN